MQFPFPHAAGTDGFPQFPVIFRAGFSRLEKTGIPAQHFVFGIAGHFSEARVDILDAPLQIGDQDGDGALLDRPGQPQQLPVGIHQLESVVADFAHHLVEHRRQFPEFVAG